MSALFPRLSCATLLFCFSVACANQADVDENVTAQIEEKAKPQPIMRTVKPGAALTFTHSFQGEPRNGQQGTVTLSVVHRYKNGVIDLQAAGDDGVAVSAATTSKTSTIVSPGVIRWNIEYTPIGADAGYINVIARLSRNSGRTLSRSYAIRVSTNQGTQQKTLDMEEVILEADETIQG